MSQEPQLPQDAEAPNEYEEEDEDDEQDLILNPETTRKVSHKKRADHAAFQDWIQLNQQEVASETKKPAQDPKYMSIAKLVRNGEGTKIINNPREYQVELFERAKAKNTIAVLPTASGKTLISAMLLRHTLEQEVQDRKEGKPRKTAFFLVEKVALAMQQHAVLSCNLDFTVDCVCGEMVESSWNREFWENKWSENMAIVCTAAILQACLSKAYIKMNQINILIFDEAHHCKGKHPYARIIKDFYIPMKPANKRPKIFGMTASPVDANTDPTIAAQHLEGLMHAEIATIPPDSASFAQIHRKVNEIDLKYERLEDSYVTLLHKKISDHVRGNTVFAKHLYFSRESTRILGPWCVDRFWQLLLTDEMITKLAARSDKEFLFEKTGPRSGAAVHNLKRIIDNHKFTPLTVNKKALSTKVLCLLVQLKQRFLSPTDHKCIIFVQQRNTALVLTDLLSKPELDLKCLKPAALIGGQGDTSAVPMSYRDQLMTIAKFKRGDFNCLVSTSVAEEGIDIPDCNVVIRFDLFTSVIQYIQSKGRARHMQSQYICMSELGNGKESQIRSQMTHDMATIRDFCQALPGDRKIAGWDAEAAAEHSERHHLFHEIPSSGAKLTWTGSLVTLATFTASLQTGDELLTPMYFVSAYNGQYICEIQLPAKSPVQSSIGKPQKSKADARCSAAFELCKVLIKKKHIDEHLQPYTKKRLPAMRNVRLAISSKKSADYKMLLKPKIWSRLGLVSSLHLTILTLEVPDVVGRMTQPLALLTREGLPELPNIPLFFGAGRKSLCRPVIVARPISVSELDVQALKSYTLRIFRDVFSKEFEADADLVPYFLAPVRATHETCRTKADTSEDLIDWDHLRSTADKEYEAWNYVDNKNVVKEKFVVDPTSGARKLFLKKVAPDLKPCDPVPEGVPEPGFRLWKDLKHTIQEYSSSLWAASRQKRQWDQEQPVFEAEVASLRRNLLDEAVDAEAERSRTCYVIMEPLKVSTLSAEAAAMAFCFPAVIHRIEATLTALNACDLLGLRIRPELALEALTKDSDNSDEHDQERINFQAGMGSNYERLEFLGDCFLKMATTISIFTQVPEGNEFDYHVERMLLICNQNLFNVALKMDLQEYIRSQQFDRRTWYPEGLKLKRGKAPRTIGSHSLSDKSIADVCEAVIGASYLTGSSEGDFDMAIRAVTAVVKNKRHKMTNYAQYYGAFKMPAWQAAEPTAVQLEMTQQIEKEMGYRFNSPALLRSAFKHPSYPRQYENIPNYQRLEFLGDALLDMVCVDFLFRKFPQADPQWLTEHKMAMVSNHFLGSLCVNLGFSRRILHFSNDMASQLKEYVDSLSLARDEAAEEAKTTGEFFPNYWLNVPQPPKFLADVLEAYIGAIFVDSQYDYSQVQRFFEAHIRPFFTDMALYDSFAGKHPVTSLGHRMQMTHGCRDWRLLVSEVPATVEEAGARAVSASMVICGFMVHGKVLLHAKSESGRYAKIATAKKALAMLDTLKTPEMFAETSGCDCKAEEVRGAEEIDFDEHATAC
ncbi:RNase3 domain-containing protein [Plectosphaerella plurivora]|uniref:Dicer-like protein 1 n=1 Tax=Plectosphaerella plurivora TaxID=936078 RepID=A0A9P8VJI8_9PEZI|nr:RNase3 domain-containing protein [Plectosphaerella plurivora]